MQLKEHKHRNIDLSKFFKECQKKYKNVYLHQIDDELFIYRAIGRKEFADIYLDKSMNDEEREEKICSNCVLYPKDFDYANCDSAGLPTEIAKKLLRTLISLKKIEQKFCIISEIRCSISTIKLIALF